MERFKNGNDRVFNLNNKDFSLVCLEAKNCIKSHKFFKRIIRETNQSYFECEFFDQNNQNSTITIAVLCANYVRR